MKGLGGDGFGSFNNTIQKLVALGKSYFAMKRGKHQNMQDWGESGTNQNMAENDNGFLNWASNLIKFILFRGMKPKEVIEEDHSYVPI